MRGTKANNDCRSLPLVVAKSRPRPPAAPGTVKESNVEISSTSDSPKRIASAFAPPAKNSKEDAVGKSPPSPVKGADAKPAARPAKSIPMSAEAVGATQMSTPVTPATPHTNTIMTMTTTTAATTAALTTTTTTATTTTTTTKKKRRKDHQILKNVPYYHGMLPRRDIEPLLRKDGEFLLRKTEAKDLSQRRFTISVMWEGEVKHFLVRMSPHRRYFLEKLCFDTVTDLIEYHQMMKAPLTTASACLLKKAVRRPDWQLTHDQIHIVSKLGEGAYGEIYKATMIGENQKEETVAVKTMRTMSKTGREDKIKFLKEARIMRTYRHPNLVLMLGVAVQEEPLMIVMEFCPGGDLKHYLRTHTTDIPEKKRVRYCQEAAEGMIYLEKHGCIHRDIASRNCLLSKKYEIKIADFGLSRQIKSFKETAIKRVPIKWLAPETLKNKIYTIKTDVWSFGVLIWEVFCNGQEPYPDMTNKEVREKLLNENYRMPPPPNIPPQLETAMLKCWAENPDDRPRFKEIRDLIKKY